MKQEKQWLVCVLNDMLAAILSTSTGSPMASSKLGVSYLGQHVNRPATLHLSQGRDSIHEPGAKTDSVQMA